MLQVKPKKAPVEKPTTKWHSLKGPFRYLFRADRIAMIETWYNTIAPERQREMFREVAKGIHTHATLPVNVTADGEKSIGDHRAQHIVGLYGAMLNGGATDRVRSWLRESPRPLVDKFCDVFSAVAASLGAVSQTKRDFPEKPMEHNLDRARFRVKIDWDHSGAAEHMRSHDNNPMDTHSHNLPAIDAGRKRGMTREQRKMQDEINVGPVVKRDHPGEGVDAYVVAEDGSTTYCPKRRHRDIDKSTAHVVATFGANTAVSWRSTTRDHICDHGRVVPIIINADMHPAISRTTASLGMIVPTLKPHASPRPGQR
jgi:hypothetical protein